MTHKETDILIVGSGAGALTAALTARKRGLRAHIIEKNPTLGGASIISGGGLWIPNNSVSRAAGIRDGEDAALKYFSQAVGDVGPASSLQRRRAFLDNGPRMIEFLRSEGFRFHFSAGYPDYYPHMDGAMGKGGGRTIESEVFDESKLKDARHLLPPLDHPAPVYTNDASVMTRMTSSASAFAYAVRRMFPLMLRALIGQKLSSMGRGLVAQLLYLNVRRDTCIKTDHALTKLLTGPGGTVIGAQIRTPDGLQNIKATHGVLLAAGGFARNKEMRQANMPSPASTEWTSAPHGDDGDAITAGVNVGAATALLDDAWWGPTFFDPATNKPWFALVERARPHCIIVDSSGARFMNEAESYTDAGHHQYERNAKINAIPAWLVLDARHRKRYMLGELFAHMKVPQEAFENGRIFKAATIEALASQIGVGPAGLAATVERYNQMCLTGVDEDFGKGGNAYDNFFGDPGCKPNPNMGTLENAPFYAIAVWPGDLGTKGGLLTDEFQRVLKPDGSVIQGLYACGNTAASIMGRTYLGAGSTLGPAMTHGFIAVNSMESIGESTS
ncbi:hypothetical protein ACHAQH_009996 [Verticillium albo-atrum]